VKGKNLSCFNLKKHRLKLKKKIYIFNGRRRGALRYDANAVSITVVFI
jgi:hypothetical protein